MSVVGFEAALEIVLQHAGRAVPPRGEQVRLLDALGRTLAEDVQADRDQPPFDRSTRDGYAVSAAEFTRGDVLRVLGEVRAGSRWTGPELAAGEALKIMTGAPLPPGADAVAMVEFVTASDQRVSSVPGRHLAPGENIVRRGSEARHGQTVLAKGSLIGPAEIALAAGCGYPALDVTRQPQVAIVSTGDELIELGTERRPADAEIWNSNSFALAALVQAAGGVAERLPTAPDTREALRERIAHGRQSDLLILSGGVSMGDYDLVEEVLTEADAEFLFTGVKMQPGKPVVFGRLPGRKAQPACFFFGLPGNPISTQVTFHCFVEPLLRALAGGVPSGPRFVQATLTEEIPGRPGLLRLLPAHITHSLSRPEVRLVSWQGSGDIAANARANGYAALPPGTDVFRPGDVISVLPR